VTPLFLDTGFILALEDADDQYHKKAKSFWATYCAHPQPLVTTSYVFDETVTLIAKRLDHRRALVVAHRLRSSASVNFVHIDETDFNAAWQWFERFQDKGFSFTDCVSFAVMKRLKVKTALTFDKHFSQAGFDKKP